MQQAKQMDEMVENTETSKPVASDASSSDNVYAEDSNSSTDENEQE